MILYDISCEVFLNNVVTCVGFDERIRVSNGKDVGEDLLALSNESVDTKLGKKP